MKIIISQSEDIIKDNDRFMNVHTLLHGYGRDQAF
jgi:hypothetical protein